MAGDVVVASSNTVQFLGSIDSTMMLDSINDSQLSKKLPGILKVKGQQAQTNTPVCTQDSVVSNQNNQDAAQELQGSERQAEFLPTALNNGAEKKKT